MSDVAFIDNDQLNRHFFEKLTSGWVVMVGDISAFKHIENELYPPGTKENQNFEVVGCLRVIGLCKKTKKFNKMFKAAPGMEITAIIAHRPQDDNNIPFEILEAKNNEHINDRYRDVASAAKNFIINGEFEPM